MLNRFIEYKTYKIKKVKDFMCMYHYYGRKTLSTHQLNFTITTFVGRLSASVPFTEHYHRIVTIVQYSDTKP